MSRFLHEKLKAKAPRNRQREISTFSTNQKSIAANVLMSTVGEVVSLVRNHSSWSDEIYVGSIILDAIREGDSLALNALLNLFFDEVV